MNKNNIRILFNKNNDGKITEIVIKEFKIENIENWPRYLYKHYQSDIGNCLAGWEEWDFVDILLYLLFHNGFESDKVIDKFYKELYQVEEFKKHVKRFIKEEDQ